MVQENNGQPVPLIPENPIISIHIEFNKKTGAIMLQAPMGNKILCYGIFEMCKELVFMENARGEADASIARPTPQETAKVAN